MYYTTNATFEIHLEENSMLSNNMIEIFVNLWTCAMRNFDQRM